VIAGGSDPAFDLDGLLRAAALPPELADAVRRTLRSAALSPEERLAVARELVAHLEDGLADGHLPDELLETFGDPELVGRMIRDARSPSWVRATRIGVRVGGSAAALFVVLYAGAATRLYSGSPERPTPAATLHALAEAAAQEQRALDWLWTAGNALASGERVAAVEAERHARALLDSLVDRPEPVVRLAAVFVAGELMALEPRGAEDPAPVRGGGRGEARTRVPEIDLDALGTWLDDYLGRVYAGPDAEGRLTAAGLRTVRALKGSVGWAPRAVLFEPVYFAAPALRQDVAERAGRLLALAEEARERPDDPAPLDAFEAELSEIASGLGPVGARYYPLALVMHRLQAALEAERLLGRPGS
jgi:predicted RNA-binding Zn ribbon-like protein